MKRKEDLLYSVVIPVFNSENIIEKTVLRVVSFFDSVGLKCEVILVNDGSEDGSWRAVSKLAAKMYQVKGINLLRNYGQHNANLCGFREALGDYVVTIDDDLQNPPEEIEKLIKTAEEGYDLVIGRFKEKKHSLFRRLGSKIVGWLNRRVFHVEKDLVLTNFRIIRRDVIDRVCESHARHPYIPGLVLMFSNHRKNVLVEHHSRHSGQSNYNIFRILRLVSTILFNHSSIPLRFVASFGFAVAGFSFLLSLYYMLNALFMGVDVPGWTTLVVLLSFFNGVLIMIISVVGEYVVRLLRENDSVKSYYIKDMVE